MVFWIVRVFLMELVDLEDDDWVLCFGFVVRLCRFFIRIFELIVLKFILLYYYVIF